MANDDESQPSVRDLEAKLSDLRDKLSPDQLERAKLCLHCIGLGGQALNNANDPAELLDVIRQSDEHEDTLSLPILKHTLVLTDVRQATLLDDLIQDHDQEKLQSLLEFPTLLITLCRKLGDDDFRRLKGSMCRVVLGCNPSTVTSREDLMKKLLQQKKVTRNNVRELKEWLISSAKRNDLATTVSDYELKVSLRAAGTTTALQVSQDDEPRGQNLENKLALIAREIGTQESDLNRRIFPHHLSEMGKILTELSGQALEEWHGHMGEKATFRALGDKLVESKLPRDAERLCASAQAVHYCERVLYPAEFVAITPGLPLGARPGSVRYTSLWEKSRFRKLRIYFMNPEVLSSTQKPWFCGRDRLTIEHVLSWAEVWNSPDHTGHPRLSTEPAPTIEDSDIRVKFGTAGRCWSYVGKEAQKHQGEATMYLNLYGYFVRDQKSLVRHEFGHALGLEHEHQRSDFWKVLEQYVNKANLSQACQEHFKPLEGTLLQTPYDPDSIMHYWFDINWLKPQYRDLDKVKKLPDDVLPQISKRVIEGVHRRDYRKGLMAESPSKPGRFRISRPSLWPLDFFSTT